MSKLQHSPDGHRVGSGRSLVSGDLSGKSPPYIVSLEIAENFDLGVCVYVRRGVAVLNFSFLSNFR